MPILHYPPVIGGFEIFTQSVAEEIGKTDDVFVVTSRVVNAPNQEIKNKLRIIRTSPWTLKNLSYTKPWFILGAMVWILFKSLRLIKKEKIDIIHAQGFLSGILAYLLKKITKKPYLITIQSADFNIYHPRLNIKLIVKIYHRIEKIIFNNAKYCHAVSNYLGSHFGGYGVKKIAVIPDGVNQDEFKPDPRKNETRKKLGFDTENLIVCVSRLEHKNGTHDLISAMNVLVNNSNTPNKRSDQTSDIKLIICGDGSERKKLEAMIEKLHLRNNVFLLGDILHKDLPKYVACADIFVRPSLAEGFGIVFLEAMAAEVAVIGTPVGGIVDFLKDKETGLFCEVRNPQDIAEKIKTLINNQDLRQRLIENARRMVQEIYNWDKISEKLKSIYRQIYE